MFARTCEASGTGEVMLLVSLAVMFLLCKSDVMCSTHAPSRRTSLGKAEHHADRHITFHAVEHIVRRVSLRTLGVRMMPFLRFRLNFPDICAFPQKNRKRSKKVTQSTKKYGKTQKTSSDYLTPLPFAWYTVYVRVLTVPRHNQVHTDTNIYSDIRPERFYRSAHKAVTIGLSARFSRCRADPYLQKQVQKAPVFSVFGTAAASDRVRGVLQ